jgi:hypothetical protein
MPDVSKSQQRLMQGIAHGMKPRSKNAPSIAVARKFVKADKAKGKGYVSSLPERKAKPTRFA